MATAKAESSNVTEANVPRDALMPGCFVMFFLFLSFGISKLSLPTEEEEEEAIYINQAFCLCIPGPDVSQSRNEWPG